MTWYNVKDLNEFVKETIKISFSKFKESNEQMNDPLSELLLLSQGENQNELLSEKEAKAIILGHVKKSKSKYRISESIFLEILLDLNSRIISNKLRILASKDIIEMAFDEALNDFVFWKKENNEKEKK
jgi:hypothetical protein